jgi:hypothetical protein
MVNYKPTVTPIATGTKLSKKDNGSCVDLTLYKRLVGSLMYLTTTRHDIMFVVSLISVFMETPKSTRKMEKGSKDMLLEQLIMVSNIHQIHILSCLDILIAILR